MATADIPPGRNAYPGRGTTENRQPLETRLLSTFPNNPDLEIQDNSANH
jgi:hypothetical protein